MNYNGQLRSRRRCANAIAIVAEVEETSIKFDDPGAYKATLSLQSSLLSSIEQVAAEHNILLMELTGLRFVGIANVRSKSTPSDAIYFAQKLVQIVSAAEASITSAKNEREEGKVSEDNLDIHVCNNDNNNMSEVNSSSPGSIESTISSFLRFLSFSSSSSSEPSTDCSIKRSPSLMQTTSSSSSSSTTTTTTTTTTISNPSPSLLLPAPASLRLKVGISSSPAVCGMISKLRPQFICVGECMVRAEELMKKASASTMILLDSASRALLIDKFEFREFLYIDGNTNMEGEGVTITREIMSTRKEFDDNMGVIYQFQG